MTPRLGLPTNKVQTCLVVAGMECVDKRSAKRDLTPRWLNTHSARCAAKPAFLFHDAGQGLIHDVDVRERTRCWPRGHRDAHFRGDAGARMIDTTASQTPKQSLRRTITYARKAATQARTATSRRGASLFQCRMPLPATGPLHAQISKQVGVHKRARST